MKYRVELVDKSESNQSVYSNQLSFINPEMKRILLESKHQNNANLLGLPTSDSESENDKPPPKKKTKRFNAPVVAPLAKQAIPV